MKPFRTEKYNDFTKPVIRKKMEKALAKVESQFGREYSIIIGGKRIRLDKKFHSKPNGWLHRTDRALYIYLGR